MNSVFTLNCCFFPRHFVFERCSLLARARWAKFVGLTLSLYAANRLLQGDISLLIFQHRKLAKMMIILAEFFVVILKVLWAFVTAGAKWVVRPKEKSVAGQVCVITGAGSGLGRLFAKEFARRRAILVLWDINSQSNEETAEMVRQIYHELDTPITKDGKNAFSDVVVVPALRLSYDFTIDHSDRFVCTLQFVIRSVELQWSHWHTSLKHYTYLEQAAMSSCIFTDNLFTSLHIKDDTCSTISLN